MGPYEQVLDSLVNFGQRKKNRTGIDTLSFFGLNLTYDLQWGFPAVTTKKLAFNAVKAELLGFLRGCTSAADFRKLGTKIWDANANENKAWLDNPMRHGEDSLGRIYGCQWRHWQDHKVFDPSFPQDAAAIARFGYDRLSSLEVPGTALYVRYVDQIANLIHTIRTNPNDRRMIVTAWNPSDQDQCALPPCHMIMQFSADVEHKMLHCLMFQRSADWFLGVPFNIASYALLLSMVAHVTGYKPGRIMITFGDAHLYENHIEQAREQISRTPFDPPQLWLDPIVEEIDDFSMNHIELRNYQSHPEIKAPMAV